MLTLEQFEQIFSHIKQSEEKDKKLTKLLVCPDSGGWIDTSEYFIGDIFALLNAIFNLDPNDDMFFWWLYDAPKSGKYVYHDLEGSEKNKSIRYDLTELEGLYFYMLKDYDKVPQEIVDNPPKYTETQSVSINDIFNMWSGNE